LKIGDFSNFQKPDMDAKSYSQSKHFSRSVSSVSYATKNTG
jgi:hypothetical protein